VPAPDGLPRAEESYSAEEVEYPVRTEAGWAKLDRAQEVLGMCELFRDLETRQLVEIAILTDEVVLKPNETLLNEGETARHLFVILEGRGVAQLKMAHGFLSLGLVGPGEAAGWSSLVGDEVYPATVRALTILRSARIDARRLERLMDIDPALGYVIGRSLSRLFCRQYKAALEAFKATE
jgi:CRP-like cAMP-binding protein